MPTWRTEVTKIEKQDDGSFEAKPPEDGKGWVPIGVHAEHVVWRCQLFSKVDTEVAEGKAALYQALLETVVEEGAESFAAALEERLASALQRVQEAERAAEFWRQKYLSIEQSTERLTYRMKGVLYGRGYTSGRRAGKAPPHEDIVLTFQQLLEDARPPLLEGIG